MTVSILIKPRTSRVQVFVFAKKMFNISSNIIIIFMHYDRHGPRIVLHVNSTCWAKSQELVCDIMLTETTLRV